MEEILVLIFTPSPGIVDNEVFLCSQAARTEPSFYFEFWSFHMSICSLHHHTRDLLL